MDEVNHRLTAKVFRRGWRIGFKCALSNAWNRVETSPAASVRYLRPPRPPEFQPSQKR